MAEERRDHKIYKYTNNVNGKVYIGRTHKTLKQRAGKNGRSYKPCTYFYNAIQRYGWDNFEGEVLEEGLTSEEAAEREMFYINKFNTLDPKVGYNLKDNDYRTYSKETLENMSKAQLGRVVSEETRRRLSESHKGQKPSQKAHDRRRELYTGVPRSEEVKNKISTTHRGMGHTEETREKLRQINKGKGSPRKGKSFSDESKKKASESHKGIQKGLRSATNKCVICVETGIEYYSITYASECTGISKGAIGYAARNGCNHTGGGFHWIYGTNNPSRRIGRRILCVETGVIYESIVEAAEQNGFGVNGIKSCLRGKNRYTAYGYHWRYVDEQA